MLQPISERRWGYGAAAHLLNRAGFGAPPAELEEWAKLGAQGAVDRLLDFSGPEADREEPAWAKPDPERAKRLREMRDAPESERRARMQEEQRSVREQVQELRMLWLERMTRTRRPLEEKLVLFWHGHFATSVQKVRSARLMHGQLELFRRHAAGNWGTLLKAVTRDPAMMVWLDQARSRREKPNENYARELMELFSLGEGHYTEQDVQAAARAFTGLEFDRLTEKVRWAPARHDDGEKRFLGRSGRLRPDDVVDQILSRDQAARHVCGRLWSFFASDPAPMELVEALAGRLRASGYEFRPVLREMFLSEAFHAPAVVRAQLKSPVQWLVTAVRQLERPLPAREMTTGALRQLVQELLAPPNVKGWDGGVAWINTGTWTRRQQFAAMLVLGREGIPEMAEGERGARLRERLRRNPRGPGAPGGPVDVARLFTETERGGRDALLKALERRFLQAPFRRVLAEDVMAVLGDDGKPDPRAVLEAVRVVLQSTDYQLT